nr:RNA polymerase sigma factor SigC [[Phormidium] sp. ETS-05]
MVATADGLVPERDGNNKTSSSPLTQIVTWRNFRPAMPGIPFYTVEDISQLNAPSFEMEDLDRSEESEVDNHENLEIEKSSSAGLIPKVRHSNTDCVRLYLEDIGRVRLLGRDEEVAESQKVQRYINLVELRDRAAQTEGSPIRAYVELVELRDRVAAQLAHRPSLERWAAGAGMEVAKLKEILAEGKRLWAQMVGMSVQDLEHIQTEGIRAKEHMIKANLRLVVSVAKKYQNRGLELLDLVQEGTLGLERAVEKFDPTRGYRFSTYAYWWIRQGITRAIATQSRTIRLPVHITEKLNKIKKTQRKLSQKMGRTPSLEEIARELDMTPAQIREVLLRVPRSVSLETKVGKEKETELGDLLETDELSPEELLHREALSRELQNLLGDLTHRERDVIEMRFGLGDGHPYSLSEISRALDLSRERVRQIEARALQKLRQPKRRNRVRDYLD